MGTAATAPPSGDEFRRRRAGGKEQKKLFAALKHFSSQPALGVFSFRRVSICGLVYFKMLMMWVTVMTS